MPSDVLRRSAQGVPLLGYPHLPPSYAPDDLLISPRSVQCGDSILGQLSSTSTSSTAWPTANMAFYIPFQLAGPILVRKLWWHNGTTVGTNNLDAGIYDEEFNRLASTGGTLSAGASALQEVDITDLYLPRGRYYLALACNGTTATVNAAGTSGGVMSITGCAQQASAYTLPNPAVPATVTGAMIPCVGLAARTLVA